MQTHVKHCHTHRWTLKYKEVPSGEPAMLGSEMKWREFFLDRRLQEIIETAL